MMGWINLSRVRTVAPHLPQQISSHGGWLRGRLNTPVAPLTDFSTQGVIHWGQGLTASMNRHIGRLERRSEQNTWLAAGAAVGGTLLAQNYFGYNAQQREKQDKRIKTLEEQLRLSGRYVPPQDT
ncbi:MAG: hypothetical protein ACKO37_08165 [Vampirovibrionales bacterium]